MTKRKLASVSAASLMTIAAVLMLATVQQADAQQRKSLRWTTSQVGTYGYSVAASMAKIAEQALGGEYTVTVQPYANPTVAMFEARMCALEGTPAARGTSSGSSARSLPASSSLARAASVLASLAAVPS